MLFADTAGWPHWLAATSITLLLWWTVASPLVLLGVAVLTAGRARLRYALTVAVCGPPLLVLLPLTVMRGGFGVVPAGAAAAFEIAAIGLSLVALVTHRAAPRAGGGAEDGETGAAEPPLTLSSKLGWAAVFCGVAGGMVGSLAFLTLFS
jgi:hypothetical protein